MLVSLRLKSVEARAACSQRRVVLVVASLAAALALTGCATYPATNVADTSATLNGLVNASGVTYWFQYGPTLSYPLTGKETAHVVAGTTNVSQPVTGLSAGTVYHYRLCENWGGGVECDADATFLTTGSSAVLPPGFHESIPISGLTQPTAVRFSPDGRVFVAEKSGLIKVFDSLSDTSPKIFADLRAEVHDFWDRGLMALALDPGFPTKPYVYVLYTYDAAIGGTAPLWPNTGCSTPATTGCVVSGRLSRLQANGDAMTGSEQVLVNDWCQQFLSHSPDGLAFGSDGALYASAGEGAAWWSVDYGQLGGNVCGDPPAGVGGVETAPTAEGGALRSQSPRRAAGEPTLLSGTLIRVDPATGAGLPDNPLASSSDANARRIVGYGLRNPFRFAIRPGTNDVWIGNVGADTWEAIDRVDNPTASAVKNFGWPCYEGPAIQPLYQQAGLNLCTSLYAQSGAVTPPYYAYNHNNQVVPGESCPADQNGTVISGLTFQNTTGDPYPSEYDGALFFADKLRTCIWAMERNGSGLPDPSSIKTFNANAANPVDLQIGPGGDLYYVDYDGGAIRRISYTGVTQPSATQPSATQAPSRQGPHGRGKSEIFGGNIP